MKTKLLLTTILLILLSGCQSHTSQQDSSTFTTIPAIENKYDQNTLNEFDSRRKQGTTNRYEGLTISSDNLLTRPENLPSSLFFDSGIHIEYPADGVKGLYLNSYNVADTEHFKRILNKLDSTPLNALVLDVKDDHGNIIPNITSDNPNVSTAVVGSVDYRSILQTLAEHKVYPIARIVTFKDNILAQNHPEYAFKTATGDLWTPDGATYYVNPFLQEVWDYNIAIAIEAAKMGFKEIQFDYIRFSDEFYYNEKELSYPKGAFENYVSQNPENEGEERVAAITQFLAYAREKLAPYGVKVSADVFGYTAIASNAPDVRGIGQHFASMAENLDVISSMIYPSHWGEGFFGIDFPNTRPYDTINEYMLSEKQTLANVSNPITTRPWIQDFTDYTKTGSNFIEYTFYEVQAQINALFDNGVREYLIWNANGEYAEGVDYAPTRE